MNQEEPYYGLAEPPETQDLSEVEAAAEGCKACHLWRYASQTVFGDGPPTARLMLIGEQPGDQEDKEGHTFIGPAGKLLRAALKDAGIDPEATYMTNAVKHFKWEPKGARRLHKRPVYREVKACYPWLQKEVELVNPQLVICLGSTAAQALFGRDFKVTVRRGEFLPGPLQKTYYITVHPSSILRANDREEQRQRFVADLKVAAEYLASSPVGKVSLR